PPPPMPPPLPYTTLFRSEAIATVREAWAAGITLFDVAPSYGRGEAEVVLGEAFGGRLPAGVRVSTKCAVGNRAAREVHLGFATRSEEHTSELQSHLNLVC